MASDPLAEMFTVRELGGGTYEAPPPAPPGAGHVFGGHVAGQALRAAAATTDDDRRPHSVHAYFVAAGKGGEPLRLEVDRVRDGKSFSVRRVTALQGEVAVLVLQASFHVDEPGRVWPEPAPPAVASPDDCVGNTTYLTTPDWLDPFELRPLVDGATAAHPFWVKAREALPSDPILHACLLVSIADIGVAGTAVGLRPFEGRTGPSLDHCVWLHRPARADEWLYFSAAAQANDGARGLATGTLVTADGHLVASIAQEILLRERPRG